MHRSFVLASLPLLCLASDPTYPRVAIGDGSGCVHLVDLERGDYRVLLKQDLTQHFSGADAPLSPSAAGAAAHSPFPVPTPALTAAPSDSVSVESGTAVLAVGLFAAGPASPGAAPHPAPLPGQSAMAAFLYDVVTLVAFSATAVVTVDTHSYRVLARLSLPSPQMPIAASFAVSSLITNPSNPTSVGEGPSTQPHVLCAACGAFESCVGVLRLHLPSRQAPKPTQPSSKQPAWLTAATVSDASPVAAAASHQSPSSIERGYGTDMDPSPVSLLDTRAVAAESPLLQVLALPPRPKVDPSAALRARVAGPGKGRVVDKPLTFKSNIKSSGCVGIPIFCFVFFFCCLWFFAD